MGIIHSCTLCENRNYNIVDYRDQSTTILTEPIMNIESYNELVQLMKQRQLRQVRIGSDNYTLKFIEVESPRNQRRKSILKETTTSDTQENYATQNTQSYPQLLQREESVAFEKMVENDEVTGSMIGSMLPSLRNSRAYSTHPNIKHGSFLSKKSQFDLEYDNSIVDIKKFERYNSNTSSTGKNKNDVNNTTVHFSYLFASPLVFDIDGKIDDQFLDEISFKDEFNNIIDELKNEKFNIKYRYQLGTVQNLIDCLRQNTMGLHFSGHGLQSESFKEYPGFKKEVAKKGDILVFEDQNTGISQFLFEKELNQILSQCPSKLSFVVIASCHSENLGMIFKKAGAEHVICVDKSKQLNDAAAVQFSRTFYSYVFASNSNICQAFQQSKNLIEANFGKDEASKMKLLLQEGHTCNCEFILSAKLAEGTIKNILPSTAIISIPKNIKPWIPRNQDTYDIIKLLINEKMNIVEVFGLPGIGKTSVIIKVANYLADRHIYKGGIIYTNLSGMQKLNDALLLIIQKLEQGQQTTIKLNQNSTLFEIQNSLIKQLRQSQNILIIFDNIEDLILKSEKQLKTFLNFLVQESDNVSVILGTNIYVDGLENFAIKHLKPLSEQKALDLFISRLASKDDEKRLFNKEMIKELYNFTLEKATQKPKELCKDPCKIKTHKSFEYCTKIFLSTHPLFKILKSPLTLCMTASMFHEKSLKEIYQKIIENEDFLPSDQTHQLILSVDNTLQTIHSDNPHSTEALYLLCTSFNGLTLDDLDQILQEPALKTVEKLMDTTFIIWIEEEQKYQVQNFIAKFIDKKIDEALRKKLNRLLATHYTNILLNLKAQVSNEQIEIEQLFKALEFYDKNILHCLQNLIEQSSQNKRLNKDKTNRKSNSSNKIFESLLNKGFENVKQRQSVHVSSKQRLAKNYDTLANDVEKQQLQRKLTTDYWLRKSNTNQKDGEIMRIEEENYDEDDRNQFFDMIADIKIEKLEQNNEIIYEKTSESQSHDDRDSFRSDEDFQSHDSEDEKMEEMLVYWQERKLNKIKAKLIRNKTILNEQDMQEDEQKTEGNAITVGDLSEKRGDVVADEDKHEYTAAINKISKMQLSSPGIDAGIDSCLQAPSRQQTRRKNIMSSPSMNKMISMQYTQQNTQVEKIPSNYQLNNLLTETIEEQEELKIPENEDQVPEENQPQSTDNLMDPFSLMEQLQGIDNESEWQILLYHYLSVQALKSTNIYDFFEIKSKFNIDQEDNIFIANIQLLLVFQFIRQKNYESAASELINIQKLFSSVGCQQGLAIVYYFLAYLFRNLKRKQSYNQAEKYLKQAKDLFSDVDDTEGQKYCSDLEIITKSMSLKLNRKHMTDLNLLKEKKYQRFNLFRDELSLNMLINQIEL